MVQGVENNGTSWNDMGGDCGGFSNTGKFSTNQWSDDSSDFQMSEVAKSKRIRLSSECNQQEGEVESSPLGLTLTRTPSFMNLVDRIELSQERQKRCSTDQANHGTSHSRSISKMDDLVSQPIYEKLKATNFSASLLKIGHWEKISKNEGHLIAKCYYAKRKLVWEILEGALKSKIELQWSDIVAIRAIIHDNEPGILEIQLNQPPLFFRETNPQPRKHTLWQQSSDFTRGQASRWRRHYVQFPPGILDKHYEKLLQCDQRLYMLSQSPFPSQESPYFEQEQEGYGFSQFSFNGYGPEYLQGLQHPHRICPTPLIPNQVQNFKLAAQAHGRVMNLGSPMSVMDFTPINETRNYAFQHNRSMLQGQGLANVVGENYIQGLPPITSPTQANLFFPGEDYHVTPIEDYDVDYVEDTREPNPATRVLMDIENQLLGDTQVALSDENILLANVQSMCSSLEPFEDINSYNKASGHQLEYGCEKINEVQEIQCAEIFYPEPINWLPPDSSMMQPQITNSDAPYAMLDSTDEDFSTLDTTRDVHNWE